MQYPIIAIIEYLTFVTHMIVLAVTSKADIKKKIVIVLVDNIVFMG